MSSEYAISVRGVSKVFNIYERPRDRLLQGLLSLAARLAPGASLRHRLQAGAQARSRLFRALDEVSFDVARGETIGIIGRNGSGKSTLLQIICGTLNPSLGETRTQGRVAALLELGSGFNPEYTGRENIYLNAQLLGLSREQVDIRYNDIVSFADIGEFIDQPVKTYSSGMFVRLAFAVIAHVDADILVVDEALAVGDAFFTQKCMRFLRKFMEHGTVLFVSHDTAAVKALCSRAIWLQNGKLIASGAAKQICDRYLAEMIEVNQGTSRKEVQSGPVAEGIDEVASVREDAIDVSAETLGSVCFLPFRPDASAFGAGGAEIIAAGFFGPDGKLLVSAEHFEAVSLRVTVRANQYIASPIVGFFVRDRLGQTLFGSNTYQQYADCPVACPAGQTLEAAFNFSLPALPDGNYTVSLAVADGTQLDHIQLHWIHDAMAIKTQGISDVGGLVGLPMNTVTLERITGSACLQCDAISTFDSEE